MMILVFSYVRDNNKTCFNTISPSKPTRHGMSNQY